MSLNIPFESLEDTLLWFDLRPMNLGIPLNPDMVNTSTPCKYLESTALRHLPFWLTCASFSWEHNLLLIQIGLWQPWALVSKWVIHAEGFARQHEWIQCLLLYNFFLGIGNLFSAGDIVSKFTEMLSTYWRHLFRTSTLIKFQKH